MSLVDQRVVVAVDVHVETGGRQHVAKAGLVHPAGELSELRSDLRIGPQRQFPAGPQRGADRAGVEVVRVLVGDHDRGRPSQGRGRVGPDAGVDDQDSAVFLQPDARGPSLVIRIASLQQDEETTPSTGIKPQHVNSLKPRST
jgi:hypothetical protein